MKQFRKYISALAVTATAAAGLILAAPAATAASNPGAVSVTRTINPPSESITASSTSVRMNPGNSFTLHAIITGSGALPFDIISFSIDGVPQTDLSNGEYRSITFSSLGSHSIQITAGPTITVSVVTEPVEAPPAHDYFQQVGVPASGSCADVPAWVGHWSGYPIGGWSKSWAQWINGGRGGSVCTREVEERPDGTIVLIG